MVCQALPAIITLKHLTYTAPSNPSLMINEQIQFTISSATAAGSGSDFATADGGGATNTFSDTDDNRIEVTAQKIVYTTAASDACANNAMRCVVVEAQDNNNNLDLDFTTDITLVSMLGTLSSGNSATPVAGVATFNAITHSATGTNLQLTASSGGLTDGLSALFTVSNPATLSTTAASSITSTTASAGGNITNDGGSPCKYSRRMLEYCNNANHCK